MTSQNRPAFVPGLAANARQKAAFDAIDAKAKALAPTVSDADFDGEGNPTGAWAELLAELDAWAKRYNVRFRNTEHVRAGLLPGEPAPRSQSACPARVSSTETTHWVGGGHITIETTCNLRRRTAFGRCVYSCVGNIVDLALE